MNENVSGIMDIDKQDKKLKKADVSSDLDSSCLEGDRSYLNLDTKEVKHGKQYTAELQK